MRSPSSRVLKNVCQIFQSSAGRDTDAGVQYPYPTLPTYSNVPCSAQPVESGEIVDDQRRVTQGTVWEIMLGQFLAVNPRDKITLFDPAGTPHIIFVESSRDLAGRGASLFIRGVERQ